MSWHFTGLAATLLLLPLFASAACSQRIVVPSAPAGKFLITDEASQKVSGVYPELLRSSGAAIGCQFDFPLIPRARFQHMFESGDGHLLIPETQTPERDKLGEFVQLFFSTPVIISTRPELRLKSVADILKNPQLRVSLVRGYDWGEQYRQASQKLKEAGMLEEVRDALTVARMMDAGRTDVTIMTAHILYGNLEQLGLQDTLGKRLQYVRSADFTPTRSGVYLSYRLPDSDRTQLRKMLTDWRSSQRLWKAFAATLPPAGLMSLSPVQPADRAD